MQAVRTRVSMAAWRRGKAQLTAATLTPSNVGSPRSWDSWRRAWRSQLVGVALASLCAHCSSATPEPAVSSPDPRHEPSAANEPKTDQVDDSVADDETTVDADVANAPADDSEAPEAASAEGAEPDSDEDAPRKVTYRVTPDGLIVDIEGARFKPSARIRKMGNGGYGIDIEVTAESTDDRQHTLLSPEHGPLSMAATIFDKQGEEARRHSDFRSGKEERVLTPGALVKLTRSWPSGAVKGPLWWGERVHIEVGLWGLGVGGERQRPVRKLFVIEMHGKGTAKPVISPPEVKR